MSDHYGPQVNRLDSRTRSLEGEVSDLESEVDSLRSKLGQVDDLDYELRDIRDDISRFQGELSELGDDVRSDIGDTDRALKQLTNRVQALEAHFRASEGAPVADFDTVDANWRQLAQLAERGRRVRAGLLSDAQREAHHSAIRAYQHALEERDAHRGKVIAACGRLATTPFNQPAHAQAAAEFSQSRTLADNHGQRAERLAAAAQKARAELAQDEALRQTKASPIEKGTAAERELNSVLRGRLADAIRQRALLPVWFVTVLGPVPPATNTQEWTDLAVQVLAYRITYGITDQVVALGPEPHAYGPRRTPWFHELTQKLKRWN
ncbi:hypothetical protein ACIRU8_45420 [Streptomyces sp. NPDC101175]|uniref:hypothetical protein n=1 Tax=Streptomyces sp. NPDC101175 TaxID=3366123 RepID=UPI0038349E67